jgi:long-chain acyl-CoA synthetase
MIRERLIGLIFPDYEMMKRDNISEEQLIPILDEIRKDVNQRFPDFMSVSKYMVHNEEFAKTPREA